MQEKIDKIRSILYVNGKCASMRLSRSYFCKLGLSHLWDWVYEETKNIPEDIKFVERLYLIEKGITAPGTCKVCGKPTKFARDIHDYQRWCSKQCQFKDEEFIETKREIWRNFSDEKLANIQKRREDTYLERYGVKYTLQHPDKSKGARKAFMDNRISKDIQAELNDIDNLKRLYIEEGHTAQKIANDLGFTDCQIIADRLRSAGVPIRKSYNRSVAEKEIEDFIRIKTNNIIVSHKIGRLECDIFIPEHKLGIEYNGLYYHSYNGNSSADDVFRHSRKKNVFEKSGIDVLFVDSYTWEMKKPACKSLLLSKMRMLPSVPIENCDVRKISDQECENFVKTNSLCDWISANENYAIFHDEIGLVACMSIKQNRLINCTSIITHHIKNPISIMMKHINLDNKDIVMSLDCCYYNESDIEDIFYIYEKTPPSKHYVMNGKLVNVLSDHNVDNLRRYWDCGQMILKLK